MRFTFHETTPAAWPAQRGSAEGGCQSTGFLSAIGSRKPTLRFHPGAAAGHQRHVSSLTLARGVATRPGPSFSAG
jgi:hypothetical protein